MATLKAYAYAANFPDQTLPNPISGNFDLMEFELGGVEVFQLGLLVANAASSVSGVNFEITGGYFAGARDFAVPIASVTGDVTVGAPGVLLASPTMRNGIGQAIIVNPPPFVTVAPYAAAWPATFNGSYMRIAAAWR
jgi:hypothetical protein